MPCVGRAVKAACTIGTVTPLAVIDRGVPDMMGIGRTLPPDPLAQVVRDVVGCQGAVFGGMPGGGQFRRFLAQRAGLKRLVVMGTHGQRAASAAGSLAIAGFDGCAPAMQRIVGTLPPDRARTVGRAVIEREQAVLRRMPISGEVGTSDAEGRSRARLRGGSSWAPLFWAQWGVHR